MAASTARPRILMIDNYDSFTYNLVQAFASLGQGQGPGQGPGPGPGSGQGQGAIVEVYRNDAITAAEAEARLGGAEPFTHLVISPGPGTPAESGVSLDLLRAWAGRMPILGVCLGHQAMAEVFSGAGAVQRAPRLMHGKASTIRHDGRGVYRGLPQGIEVGRYHSLCVMEDRVPPGFVVTARTDAEEIMGMRHEGWKMEGVQFHPESVLTPRGMEMLANFVRGAGSDGATEGEAGRVMSDE